MKRIGIFLIFLLCISCAGKTSLPQSVDIPRKEAEMMLDEVQEKETVRERPGVESEARRLNSRLQEIIADSPISVRDQIFTRDETDESPKDLSFSFYDADLVEVVRVFMKLLEQDYIIHPDVSGRVSLFVDDNFNSEQLLDLLSGVLRVNNMAMIRPDNVWEILPQSKVSRHIAHDRIIFPDSEKTPRRGQIIQGFRLNFIAASEMINILTPYLSQNAQVYAHEDKGVLLVSDFPHSLERVSELVNVFDESIFADVYAKVFPLRYISSDDAAEELKGIAETFGLERTHVGARARVSFLPLERMNMVLAVTRSEQVLDFVEAWVDGLDQELPDFLTGRNHENIYVYYVQYGDAEEIVSSLQGVFEDRGDRNDQNGPVRSPDAGEGDERSSAVMGSVSGELSGRVTFTVDSTTNSIITRCNSLDYPKVLSVIEKLDLYPRQVLIEVVIAEVNLTDQSSLGVDWRYLLSFGDGVTGAVSAGSPGQQGSAFPTTGGGVFGIASANRLRAVLQANLSESKMQILSTPTLLASDNKPATINIGDQIPYPTSSRRRVDDSDRSDVVDTTIQYRDTGIILKVTPKINQRGMVRMEISQEVSTFVGNQTIGEVEAPVVNTRHTETTLAVGDQETVVIAGLMEQIRDDGYTGVPFLGRVPGVRNLFGEQRSRTQNKELLVFITPHVIISQDDSRFLTRNFLSKLDDLKENMR
ncbi:type II secretion system secretin GspD [Desulfonatronovibrio magnus]|uniref:type II secretion system secretin GspD n=1 Tax=Desulfonatronovibrio magnus TaxID=698827 RepID=UPI0005EAF830|nr:type II secretion system secretin GspD [Desulfonatronovibrio magnus]